jgi:phosphoribosyl 1,2-cyclic phosphodiesterase
MPDVFGSPAHMDHFQNLPDTRMGDNGGVHVNSGIRITRSSERHRHALCDLMPRRAAQDSLRVW